MTQEIGGGIGQVDQRLAHHKFQLHMRWGPSIFVQICERTSKHLPKPARTQPEARGQGWTILRKVAGRADRFGRKRRPFSAGPGVNKRARSTRKVFQWAWKARAGHSWPSASPLADRGNRPKLGILGRCLFLEDLPPLGRISPPSFRTTPTKLPTRPASNPCDLFPISRSARSLWSLQVLR